MQQSSFELAGTSILAPALVAGAVVTAFFASHYSTERKNRRDFLRWCESNRPRPLAETLADPPTLGDHRRTHPSGYIVEPLNSFMISGTHGWLGALLYFTIGLGIVWFKRPEEAAEPQALASDIAYVDRLKELDRERALRAMLAHIVETWQDAIFSLTTEGRIITWNTATEKLFGFSGQEAIGQPIALIVPPEQRPKAKRILSTLQRGEPTQQLQSTLNCKDGSRVEVSLTACAARDAAGKVVGVSVVARPRPPAS